MSRNGELDSTYPTKLLEIDIELQESFKGAKIHHRMKCLKCKTKWVATPISKLQAFKKCGFNGCPNCHLDRQIAEKKISRAKNIQTLVDKGLEIISDWSGARVSDANNTPIAVTVRNTICGHTFTSSSVNLLTRNLTCTVCGIKERTSHINDWSKQNSDEWKKTATEWKIYKSTVTKLTKQAYKQYKVIINPNNLPSGKAGTEGAYHIDHIVPIRYCFNNNIPEEVCAHYTNLQMLNWRDNVGSRDKLKEYVPNIFEKYVNKA